MLIITMMTGLAMILFFGLVMSIISRLNSLAVQRDRIIDKINQATEKETALKEQALANATELTE